MGQFDNALSVITKKGKQEQVSKVNVANYITKNSEVDFSILDLDAQLKNLIVFIMESNPSTHNPSTHK